MKAFITPAYTFTPGASGAGTVNLSGITGFEIKRLVAIINQTAGKLIYSTGNEALKYTAVTGTTVTLFFNTATMSAGDVLQVIYESPDTFATQATLASLLTELQLKADLAEAQPVSGPLTDAQLRAAAVPVNQAVLTPTFAEDLTVTTAVETIVAPANARWCKIMTECTGGDMRVKLGGVASATSGFKFQDGRSEDFAVAGNVSYVMEAGTGKIYVTFGA